MRAYPARGLLRCPTCGAPKPIIGQDAKVMVALSKRDDAEIYKGRDGNWYVTHGLFGWPISQSTMDQLEKTGRIRTRFPDTYEPSARSCD